MAYSAQSHRSTMSMSTTSSLALPSPQVQQRRLSHPPPAPLDLPEPTVNERRGQGRPPSPLRNGVIADPFTGELSELSEDGSVRHSTQDGHDDHDAQSWSERSQSPTPSMAQLATTFAQRVGSLVSNMSPRSGVGGMPTDEELEAEAEREREMSRREAERILMREAQERERKHVEDRVLALLHNNARVAGSGSNVSSPSDVLPPPPSRSQSSPNPPSPSPSQKESTGWFATVKSKLTPTKDPPTPAQQIILETKAREKEKKKNKDKDKDKDKDKGEWPSSPSAKTGDPAFLNLATSAAATAPINPHTYTPNHRYSMSTASPTSPTPASRTVVHSQSQPSLSPSPMRSSSADSPSREAAPFYAQFNAQGTLDVPATLLVIAGRFEKLERWTVGHVRALEERMGDVERWLVEKEKEKETQKELDPSHTRQSGHEEASLNDETNNKDLAEIREEMAELSGRVSEIGREMAKFATAQGNLSSGPSRSVASSTITTINPMTAVHSSANASAARSLPTLPPLSSSSAPSTSMSMSTPQPLRGRSTDVSTTSPPPLSAGGTTMMTATTSSSRTRLPYPTGDYTSPPGSVLSPLSPTSSPPSSLSEARNKRPISIAGLPTSSSVGSTSSASISQQSGMTTPSGLPRSSSPVNRLTNLTPPKAPASSLRPSSASPSPTPRKRYTVALGGPIVPPPSDSEENTYRGKISASPVEGDSDEDGDGEESGSDGGEGRRRYGHAREETIGKSAARMGAGVGKEAARSETSLRLRGSTSFTNNNNNNTNSNSNSNSNKFNAYANTNNISADARPSPPGSRIRAQSAYGAPSGYVPPPSPSPTSTTTPLRPRIRTRSTDRFRPGSASGDFSSNSAKFVDPLVIRKQEKDKVPEPRTPKATNGRNKVPIGDLVKFFDGDK
ncbi:hypothetical protein BD410DRAFT_818478 [Rickenella mellea]|uniref:Uncharacterized protein n=1 Tax=Rickenella mellea TaxID=50990 RepID=A0A4Y7QKR1_9AGAM|nr:hypothetical protein BD410DRAFT_818478 [Rickenella mellea]